MAVNDDIYEWILKKLSDELTQSEYAIFKNKLNKTAENGRLYRQIKWIVDEARKMSSTDSVDTDEVLLRLHQKIEETRTKQRILRRKSLLKYAAAILLFITTATGLYFFKEIRVPSGEKRILADFIATKKNNPRLTLENGNVITLFKTKKIELENDIGVFAINDTNELRYLTTKNQTTAYHTLTVPKGGGVYHIRLSDNSEVWLNSGSELRYPVKFDKDERRLYLKGEAYFEVSKKHSAFVVRVKEIDVRVTGTAFNIMAYGEDAAVKTTLVEGSVQIIRKNKDALNLFPGEQATYQKEDGNVVIKQVNTAFYTSWKDGRFDFHNMSLMRLASVLERWYNIHVKFKNKELKKLRFTGVVKQRSVSDLVALIEKTTEVKFEIKNDTIVIKKANKN